MRSYTQKATAAMVAAAMPAPSASVTITDNKAHTVAPATLDPANRKASIVAKTFKGNFPADTLYISTDICTGANLVQSGTKLTVSA